MTYFLITCLLMIVFTLIFIIRTFKFISNKWNEPVFDRHTVPIINYKHVEPEYYESQFRYSFDLIDPERERFIIENATASSARAIADKMFLNGCFKVDIIEDRHCQMPVKIGRVRLKHYRTDE